MDNETKKWTPEEDALIIASNEHDAELAERFGVTKAVIHNRRHWLKHPGRTSYNSEYLKLLKKYESRRNNCLHWTADEDKLIMSSNKHVLHLSRELGRSVHAIYIRRRRLIKKIAMETMPRAHACE